MKRAGRASRAGRPDLVGRSRLVAVSCLPSPGADASTGAAGVARGGGPEGGDDTWEAEASGGYRLGVWAGGWGGRGAGDALDAGGNELDGGGGFDGECEFAGGSPPGGDGGFDGGCGDEPLGAEPLPAACSIDGAVRTFIGFASGTAAVGIALVRATRATAGGWLPSAADGWVVAGAVRIVTGNCV